MAMTVEKLRQLVAMDPNDPLSRFALGRKLLEKNESVTEAVEHLAFAHEKDPSHLATYHQLAKALIILGRKDAARRVLNKGILAVGEVGEGMGRDLGPAMREMLAALDAPRRELPAEVRLGRPEEVIELRHRVLRQDLPRESAIFPNDDADNTLHGVALVNGQVVCCATIMFEPVPAEVEGWGGKPAWRLRGMATDPAHRSMNLGRRVLTVLEPAAQAKHPTEVIWCNARIGAVKFYESMGWQAVTQEPYDIPTAGLHHTMVKRVG